MSPIIRRRGGIVERLTPPPLDPTVPVARRAGMHPSTRPQPSIDAVTIAAAQESTPTSATTPRTRHGLLAREEPATPSPGTPASVATALIPRDYQELQFQAVLAAHAAGRDRVIVRAPWQTGKTLNIQRYAHHFREHVFPGKTVLIISPLRNITADIADDFRHFPGYPASIGMITAQRKDFAGDHAVIIASAYTLGRPDNLARLKVDDIGLVIVDEATFALAPTWKRILARLGFLDDDGQRQSVQGHFLIGLTADPFSLRDVFGPGAVSASPSLRWFIEKGHLHNIVGERVRVRRTLDYTQLEAEGERIVTPTATALFAAEVVALVKDRLHQQHAIIYVASIDHATAVIDALNHACGPDYAVAVTAETDDDTATATIARFNAGAAPHALVSIWRLAYGARLRADAVVHTYDTASLRRFGQRSGRALGMSPGEVQRTIACLTMSGAGHVLQAASLSRLFGVYDVEEDGIAFNPLQIAAAAQSPQHRTRRRRLRPVQAKGALFKLTYEPVDVLDSSHALPVGERFAACLQQVLAASYNGDSSAMADACELDLDTLDRYLQGEVPAQRTTVEELARHLPPELSLLQPWLADTLEVVEAMYPTHLVLPPELEQLVRVVRWMVLMRGNGSMRQAVTVSGVQGWHYYRAVRAGLQGTLSWNDEHMLNRLVTWLRSCSDLPGEFHPIIEAAHAALAQQLSEDAFDRGRLHYVGGTFVFGATRGAYNETERIVAQHLQWPSVLKMLSQTLTRQEERIIRAMFGIGEVEKTVAEIAEDFFCSQARVNSTAARALRKLRRPAGVSDAPRQSMRDFVAAIRSSLRWNDQQWAQLLLQHPHHKFSGDADEQALRDHALQQLFTTPKQLAALSESQRRSLYIFLGSDFARLHMGYGFDQPLRLLSWREYEVIERVRSEVAQKARAQEIRLQAAAAAFAQRVSGLPDWRLINAEKLAYTFAKFGEETNPGFQQPLAMTESSTLKTIAWFLNHWADCEHQSRHFHWPRHMHDLHKCWWTETEFMRTIWMNIADKFVRWLEAHGEKLASFLPDGPTGR